MFQVKRFLVLLLTLVTFVAAACGGPAEQPATADESVSPALASGDSAEDSTKERVLRVGLPFLFTNQPPDPAKGGGFHLIQTGLGETLFKLGKDLKPEPWRQYSGQGRRFPVEGPEWISVAAATAAITNT